jgi:hypothetical protein
MGGFGGIIILGVLPTSYFLLPTSEQKKAAPPCRAATFTLLLQAKIDQWLNNHSRYFINNNPLYKVAVILIFAYYFTLNKQLPMPQNTGKSLC